MDKIPFYKVPLGTKEAKAVSDVIKTGWITFGSKTEEFEKRFARYINAPYCVMTNSCTNGLFLAMEYKKKIWQEGGIPLPTVTVPSLTCAATALAPLWAGYKIEFGDLEPNEDFLMADQLKPAIPVHYAGKFNKQEFPIIEDSAHRILPNTFEGYTTCYSFYATKNLTTGEGGMIACSTEEEATWYKKARLYGIDKAAFKREGMFQTGDKFWEFQSEFIGWKCNPTDIVAAIGLVQLERMPELRAKRLRVANWYNSNLNKNVDREAWHLYPILVNDRDIFMHYMKDVNIFCSVHFCPLHRQKAFIPFVDKPLPVTDWVYDHIVSLPFYPDMTKSEVDIVSRLVKEWETKHGKCDFSQFGTR